MSHIPFTVEGQRIALRAASLCTELEHPAVGTEHLLLAMLEVPSLGAGVLQAAGATAERVRSEVADRTRHYLSDDEALRALGIEAAAVRQRIEAAFGPDSLVTEPAWTDLALQVRIDAAQEADAYSVAHALPMAERVVGTDWLFLALLDHEEGVASQVIAAVGVDQAEARAEIARQIPTMIRFRHQMWVNPVHARYRAILASWTGLDAKHQAASRHVFTELHRDHDRVVAGAAARLLAPGADEPAVMNDYFTAIEQPVEHAALALASLGVAVSDH
jgi:ATP-dependent Clp protease ATP-binding subunit ClpA